MLLEGTSLYFWLIILILLLTYIVKKIALTSVFKKVRLKGINALIPIKYRIDLADALHLNRSVAYMAYIPFYGIKYRKLLLETLLEGFGLNPKDYIYYLLFPMYKYPELAFRNVLLIQNDYSLTENFLESEKILSGEKKEAPETTPDNENNQNKTISDDINYTPNMVSVNSNQDIYPEDSVFTNPNLTSDKHHETHYEAKNEVPKEEKPIITPLDDGKEKICPNCGAKLSASSTVCFFCGKQIN